MSKKSSWKEKKTLKRKSLYLMKSKNLTLIVPMSFFLEWLTDERCLALFQVVTIFRDPHHHESPTRCEQGLNLRRT